MGGGSSMSAFDVQVFCVGESDCLYEESDGEEARDDDDDDIIQLLGNRQLLPETWRFG